MPVPGPPIGQTRVHHYGYIVDDLEEAMHRAVRMFGTGPFLLLDHVPLEGVTCRGQPAEYAHSTAFAQWGESRLELTQIHGCGPAAVRDAFTFPGAHVGHVAWAVSALPEAIARLEADGAPSFLRATLGEISVSFHDARATWGHHIELHADTSQFRALFEQVREISVDWDGRDPIRTPSGAAA